MTDPYRVLGVREDATQDEIASAYHRLVRRYHPDATAGSTESDRFREVVAAYTALRDHAPGEVRRPMPRETEPAVRVDPVAAKVGPVAIRVGPVRYHGPPRPP